VKGFFEIGSHGTICPSWLRTVILLNSASEKPGLIFPSPLLLFLECKVWPERKNKIAGHQWLRPVILATPEAEIRRITV
jgi:hypothetical protein